MTTEHDTLGEQLFLKLGDVQRDHPSVRLFDEKLLAARLHQTEVAARVVVRTRGLRGRLARLLVGCDQWDTLRVAVFGRGS